MRCRNVLSGVVMAERSVEDAPRTYSDFIGIACNTSGILDLSGATDVKRRAMFGRNNGQHGGRKRGDKHIRATDANDNAQAGSTVAI